MELRLGRQRKTSSSNLKGIHVAETQSTIGPGRSRRSVHTKSWLGADPAGGLTSQKVAARWTFLGSHTNLGGRDPSLGLTPEPLDPGHRDGVG